MTFLKSLSVTLAMATFVALYSVAIKFSGVVEFGNILFWGMLPVIIILRLSRR